MKKDLYKLVQKDIDSSEMLERRVDNQLRQAISALQELIAEHKDTSFIFKTLLEQLLEVGDCDHGVMYFAEKNQAKTLQETVFDNLDSIDNFDGQEIVSSIKLKQLFEMKILSSRPVLFNKNIPACFMNILMEPKSISAMTILPIMYHEKLVSMCFLFKQDGRFNHSILERLLLLSASAISSHQSGEIISKKKFWLGKQFYNPQFVENLLAMSMAGIFVVDESKNIVYSNLACDEMFRIHEANILNYKNKSYTPFKNLKIYELLPEYDLLLEEYESIFAGSENMDNENPKIWLKQPAQAIDGLLFNVSVSLYKYTESEHTNTILYVSDETAVTEIRNLYNETLQQLRALSALVPAAIIQLDKNLNCQYANDKWYEFSGLVAQESEKLAWLDAVHDDDVKLVKENLRKASAQKQECKLQFRLVTPLGKLRWIELSAKLLLNDEGVVKGSIGTLVDITERLSQENKLRQIAEYDSLTGLANRFLFQNNLKDAFALSEKNSIEIEVFFIDLDGFKDVNDTLGHDAGDQLLQEVASRLLSVLRRNDVVARFGGDEFVILLSLSDNDKDCSRIAEKILAVLSNPYQINGQEVFITASIGIATGTAQNSSPKQLLKQADSALYRAKYKGKHQAQKYNKDINAESKKRMYILNQLRTRKLEESFFLVYQPQASTLNKKVVGYEALLRFRDDENNIYTANEFIHILEETDAIKKIGLWVFESACKQYKICLSKNPAFKDIVISINMSPKQLLDKSILDSINKILHEVGVRAENIVIELTESLIIHNRSKVLHTLQGLKNMGFKLALDDFGTGYSSLTYIQEYPFDFIKIDKSFILNILADSNDEKISKAIILLSHSLGLKVIAEGVTNEETLKILQKYEADYFQGYFFGEPLGAEELK